jgi:hypothetical protein
MAPSWVIFPEPAFSTDQLGGCIVAVRRGVPEGSTAKSSFGDKVSKCIDAGAVGVIIVNKENVQLAPSGADPVEVPVVCVSKSSDASRVSPPL